MVLSISDKACIKVSSTVMHVLLRCRHLNLCGRRRRLKPQEVNWAVSVLLHLGMDLTKAGFQEVGLALLQNSLQGALTLVANDVPPVKHGSSVSWTFLMHEAGLSHMSSRM